MNNFFSYTPAQGVHVIVDTNHLLYRAKQITKDYTYQGKEGLHGLLVGDNITVLMGILSSIETIFQNFGTICPNNDVTVSFTFDHRNKERSEIYPDYKKGRPELASEDKNCLNTLQEILSAMGFNVYSYENYEADDLITSLVRQYKDRFLQTFIYTNDADLLTNLSENVAVQRYKSTDTKYTLITKENFVELMEAEYGCRMTYNAILLYKALVGDPSDNIKGVKGFGKKAFDKLIHKLGPDFPHYSLLDPNVVKQIIENNADLICKSDPEKLEQAFLCLKVILPVIKECELGTTPLTKTIDKRREEYANLGFHRLWNRVSR